MESANNKYDVRDCPVCYDPFSQNSNVTLLKPCLHVMCNECWTNLFWHTAAAQEAASIPIAKCPACMQPVEKPKDIHFRNDTQHVDLTAPPTPTIVPAPTTNRDVSPLTLPDPVVMTETEFNAAFPIASVALPHAPTLRNPAYHLGADSPLRAMLSVPRPRSPPPTRTPTVVVAIPRPRPHSGPPRRRRRRNPRTYRNPGWDVNGYITHRTNSLVNGTQQAIEQMATWTPTPQVTADTIDGMRRALIETFESELAEINAFRP